jgi:hypothetical protein
MTFARPAAPMSQRVGAPRGPTYGEQVQFRRGDVAMLGRFVLATERALEDIGLEARRGSLAELHTVLQANLPSWGGVAPAFDASQTLARDEDLGIILATDRTGTVVATCAQRFYDLGTETLKTAIESNAFMHAGHPAGDRSRVRFEITAPVAETITGRISLLGGLWVRPDLRGSGVTVLLCDLTRTYSLGMWDFETEILVGRDSHIRQHVLDQYGIPQYQSNYRHYVDGKLYYDGHLMWSDVAHRAAWLAGKVERSAVGRQSAATG